MSVLTGHLKRPHPSADLRLGLIDTLEGWSALEPFWDALLVTTPGASVFQTYPYLRTWWDCLGSGGELFIIVVSRSGTPVAIAPLQITRSKQLWARVRTVSYIGQPSESDRPNLLGAVDGHIADAIADFLILLRDRWASIVLFEQPLDSALVVALRRRLCKARYLMAQIDGNECPYIDVKGTWDEYLAGRSKSFRKSIKRRRAQLEGLGHLEFEPAGGKGSAEPLARFRAVEDRSWKRAQNLGIARSERHWKFHQQLARCEGPADWMRFGFLKLDGQDIAATMGLMWRHRFYSLHVVHDAAQVDTSPGVVVTAMELEPLFTDGSCEHYDFLGGFLTNKLSWATGSQHTTALFGDRPGLRSWLFHLLYFRLKPLLRRFLERTGYLERVSQALRKFRRWRKPPPVEA